MVRLGALDMLDSVPPDQLWPLVSPLLGDPVRAVRIRAAGLLAGAPTDGLSGDERKRLDQATNEFIAAQELNADRPESRTMLGGFDARRGEMQHAEAEYQAAIRLSPSYATASANLADLYRQLGRDQDAETVLRKGLESSPQDAGLHHALGLTLVRLKRQDEALAELGRAAELEPDRSRYTYVYAIGLDSAGRRADAEQVLKDNLAKHPNDRDTLEALLNFAREARDAQAALTYGEQLLKLEPDNVQLKAMVGALHRQKAPPPQ
jgi:tetratricopeptide (TPR) repeat protein